jgi:F0F1-type ATP synthase assembly protein I
MSGEGPDPLKRMSGVYRDLAPFLSLGFQLAGAVVILFFIGRWADGKWGTAPFGQLAGVLIGCVGGLIKLFRSVEALNTQESTKDKR